MNLVFNLNKFSNKILLSSFIILVFYMLFLTVPDYEFNNINNNNSKIDRFYFVISNHIGIHNGTIQPTSFRAKILTLCQMIISYSILII
ncbi:MAG: hypothetical protein CM15mP63_4620 [Gammaproteobacteria bacterium]|jgi:hypothetical protein|nr:MAG: hypothetical protein CM15mP63_4620 [Gammaproteobacteria bacterium]